MTLFLPPRLAKRYRAAPARGRKTHRKHLHTIRVERTRTDSEQTRTDRGAQNVVGPHLAAQILPRGRSLRGGGPPWGAVASGVRKDILVELEPLGPLPHEGARPLRDPLCLDPKLAAPVC